MSNNPKVRENCENVCYFECPAADILVIARDLVYEGYELVSHPMAASIRLIFSPYKSIILGRKLARVDYNHAQVIEAGIEKYSLLMSARFSADKSDIDYRNMDYILLKHALAEADHQL
ncbi:MAG TPA: GrdX family protein [Selenomonadales bacterium]|nr:GrdX family protein [Selenomonadales bacterium]